MGQKTVKTVGKLHIDGWAGQHDEAGASIRNEDGTIHLTTPQATQFKDWQEYQRFAKELVERWNAGEKSRRKVIKRHVITGDKNKATIKLSGIVVQRFDETTSVIDAFEIACIWMKRYAEINEL